MKAPTATAAMLAFTISIAFAAAAQPDQPLVAAQPNLDPACDGSRDVTSAIAEEARKARALLVIPPNCRFDRAKLLRELAEGAVLLDLSTINGFASPGETTKSVGILARDSAANDSQWLIGSGHHPVLNLNNFGLSGTGSGTARRASMLWSAGDFVRSASKTGFRGAGMLQFGQEGSGDQWSLSLRSLAPFAAVRGNYEMWAANERIAGAGIYRSTGQAILVSMNGGTTGRTAPHARLGAPIRDGTVSWRHLDSADRSIMRISEHGRVLFGLGDFEATFRHKVSIFEPGHNVVEWAASGPDRDVLMKWLPTESTGAETQTPGLRASANGGLALVSGVDYATPLVRFDNRRGLVLMHTAVDGIAAAPANSALDVAGRALIYVRAAPGQRIEKLTGGLDGQMLQLVFLGGATLVSGSGPDSLHLEGSRALQATRNTVISLQKLPNGLGGEWVETSRSVK